MSDLEFLTIQERIELYKNNMAFSPSDAARKISSLAEASMFDLIDNDKFVEKEKLKRDTRSALYKEFCSKLSAAISKELCKTDKSPYESRFGNDYSDYIYIAALSLASVPVRCNWYYDKPDIYYNLRMTLGNYLDTLIDISYDIEKDKPNTGRANQYRMLKKEFSGIIDLSTLLCEAIGILLSQYSDSHAVLNRVNHIQRCKSDLDQFIRLDEKWEKLPPNDEGDSRSDEEENEAPDNNAAPDEKNVTDIRNNADELELLGFIADDNSDPESDEEIYGDDEDDEDFDDDDYDEGDEDFDDDTDPEYTEQREKEMIIAAGDPYAYFLSKAKKLPGISVQSPEKLYDMGNDNPNLLAGNDYSPEGIKAWAAELSPEFREIADELITAEGIANAFKGMDDAIDKLYRLLIEPFVEIEKYRFMRHPAQITY